MTSNVEEVPSKGRDKEQELGLNRNTQELETNQHYGKCHDILQVSQTALNSPNIHSNLADKHQLPRSGLDNLLRATTARHATTLEAEVRRRKGLLDQTSCH